MPDMPARPCRRGGCPALVPGGGFCPAHEQQNAAVYDKTRRPKRQKFYDTQAWRTLRAYKIAQQPTCEACAKYGRVVIADEVHHEISIEERPDLALMLDNLRSLCRPCHQKIEAERKKQRGTW